MTAPWQPIDGGLRLAVKLTPRASRSSVDGVTLDAQGRSLLCIRIPAAPVDGEANRALVRFIAKVAGVRQADVSILNGETSRLKVLRLAGDPSELTARLDALVG